MDDGCFLKKCDRKKSFFSFMKSFEKKKSENEHFHDRSVVRIRPPPIFGFILTSRIPQNTSQLRGKEDPEREREREKKREKRRRRKARATFITASSISSSSSSSFLLLFSFLCVCESFFVNEPNARTKTTTTRKAFRRGELVVAFSRIFSPQKEKKKKGRTQVERG